MAKKISANDIFENEDVFKGVRQSADATIKLLEKINGEFRKTATTLKGSIGGAKFDNSKAINEFIKATQKANQLRQQTEKLNALQAKTQQEVNKALQQGAKVQNEQNKANQQAQKVEQEKQKTSQQALKTEQEKQKVQRETIKTQREQAKEAERQANAQAKADKATRDANSAYKQLERNTRELKNQSKELGAQMLRLEADGRKNSTEYQRLAQTYQQVTQKAREGDAQLKKLDRTVGDNFRNVGNYRDALGGLQNVLGQFGLAFGIGSTVQYATRAVMDFEQVNATLSAVLGTTMDKTKGLQQIQRDLGKTSGFTASQVGELQLELARLGFTEKDLNSATESVLMLAKASGSELGRSAEVAGATLRGFGLSANETQRVVDVMAKSFDVSALGMENFAESMKYVAPVAKSAGVSIEETTAMLGVLSNVGISGSQAGTALRRILGEMAKTGKPASEALADLAQKGITLADAEDEVGKNAQTALLALVDNTEGMRQMTLQLQQAEGASKKTATTMGDTLGGSLNRLRGAFEGYILDLNEGTGAGEKLRNGIEFLTENLETILDAVITLADMWVKYKVITLAQIGYNKLMQTSFMQTATQMGGLTGVINGAKGALASFGNMIKQNIAGIAVFALYSLYQRWSQVNEALGLAKKNNEDVAKAQREVTNSAQQEKNQMTALFDALKKTNNGSVERRNLIDEINSRYGTTLQNLANEKEFVKQVDQEYKNLMATLGAKTKVEGKRVAFEVSQANLSEVEMQLKGMFNKLKGFKNEVFMLGEIKDGKAPKASKRVVGEDGVTLLIGGLIKDLFGVEDVNQVIKQYNALAESYEQIYKDAQQYEKEYNAVEAQYIMKQPKKTPPPPPPPPGGGGGGVTTGPTSTPDVKDYEFSMNKLNEYLSQQITLLQELETIYQEANFTKKLDQVDGQIMTVVARAKNRAIEGLDPLDFVIPGEMYDETEKQIIALFDLSKQTAKQRTDFAISEINRLNQFEKDEAKKTIDDNYAEQKKQYQKELEDLKTADPKTTNITQSKANLNKALKKLDDEYKAQLDQLAKENLKRDEDANTKVVIEKEKLKAVEVQVEKDKNDKIIEYNDQLNTAIEDGITARADALETISDADVKKESERIDKLKERWATMTEFVKEITNFFIEQSDRRIKKYEEEKTKAEGVYDTLKQLAINGNIDAQKSLAEQQRTIDEYNKKIQREEKRQQRLKLASTAFESYNKNIQNLEPGQKSSKALADTIRDITLLTQFVNALPTFYDGTEDTGTHGQGVDGRGGFKAILHPNERVIPKKLNDQIGRDLTNEQLTQMAVQYKTGRLIRDGEQTTSALNLALLVNKLDEVNETIKNKPESYYGLGEVTQTMVEIIDQKKKGNTVIYNRYRVKK
jgi:hypothetical protein